MQVEGESLSLDVDIDTDEDAVLPSETKLEIKQQGGGAVVEHTLLPHEAYSMRINWDNPPLSPEASEEERQQWQDREKQALLGITNYSRVYSFLYIDDFEVRHEILIPYLSLDEDLLLARDDDPLLDLTEQDLARKQIEGYFASGNPLEKRLENDSKSRQFRRATHPRDMKFIRNAQCSFAAVVSALKTPPKRDQKTQKQRSGETEDREKNVLLDDN